MRMANVENTQASWSFIIESHRLKLLFFFLNTKYSFSVTLGSSGSYTGSEPTSFHQVFYAVLCVLRSGNKVILLCGGRAECSLP